MTHQPAMPKRKPRADAIRNRERVLEAAKAVFSQGGPEASLEAVAQACRRRDRDTVSALPDQGGPVRGGLPARGGAACRTGQAARGRDGAGRGAAPLAAGRRRIHGDEEGHGGGARHGRARFLGARGLLARPADQSARGTAAACRRQREKFVPTSTPRTCSVPWSACATPTTGRAGKPRCCAWSISSSMDYAGRPIRDTIDRPVTLLEPRNPDIRCPHSTQPNPVGAANGSCGGAP